MLPPAKAVASWQQSSVDDFVCSIGLSCKPPALAVDGSTFLGLSDEDLTLLGVKRQGDRRLLLEKIEGMWQQEQKQQERQQS